jgi:hypothetical protein
VAQAGRHSPSAKLEAGERKEAAAEAAVAYTPASTSAPAPTPAAPAVKQEEEPASPAAGYSAEGLTFRRRWARRSIPSVG